MLFKFYSNKLQSWINISECIYAKTDLVANNQFNKDKKYYVYEKTSEVVTNKTRIKYICLNCNQEFETAFSNYMYRNNKLCLKCIQKIKSNDPIIKERKRQIVLKRDISIREKQRKKLKTPEINNKRIKAFQRTMNNLSQKRKNEIKNKKQKTWYNKSEKERLEIMEKQRKSGTLWKILKTKFGEIKCQGYEDRAVIKLLELGVDKLQRGPSIKMDNGHWHYPDLYIEKDNKKIIIEVKSQFLYNRYKNEIEYKKSQGLKNYPCNDYYLWIFDDKDEVNCPWLFG